MRLRPAFLKAHSGINSGATPGAASGGVEGLKDGSRSGGGSGGGGGLHVDSVGPAMLPPRQSRGNSGCDARASSGASQTSISSMLSSRELPSPGNSSRGASGGFRRRASTTPVSESRGGGGGRLRWGRRRGVSGSSAGGASGGSKQVIVVTAVDLEDEGLGVFPRAGYETPRGTSLGGAAADDAAADDAAAGSGRDSDRLRRAIADVDWDDEALMERGRGDGDGLTDESEEEGDPGRGGGAGGEGAPLGRPGEGVRSSGPGFFQSDEKNPGSSRAAFFGGDLDGPVSSAASPLGKAGKSGAGASERHRHRKWSSERVDGEAGRDAAKVSSSARRHPQEGEEATGAERKGEPLATA
ncbi:unnamed protein product, partial [Scytosiphon promiscuus]